MANKTQKHRAPIPQSVAFSCAFAGAEPERSEDGVIILKGVSIMTAGVAKGHCVYEWGGDWDYKEYPMAFDEKALAAVVKFGNAAPQGIKVRSRHESFGDGSPVGTELGVAKNFRVEGNKALADIYFYETPQNTGLVNHILTFADKAPDTFGISAVMPLAYDEKAYNYKYELRDGVAYCMPTGITAADFVSSPALNDSLFSDNKTQNNILMTLFEKMLSFAKPKDTPKQKPASGATGFGAKVPRKTMKVQVQFGTASLEDGAILVFPSDTPTVGDEIKYETGDPVEDGVYNTTDGYVITVSGGLIESVVEVEVEEVKDGDKDGEGGMSAEVSEALAAQRARTEKIQAEVKALAELQRLKDEEAKAQAEFAEKQKALAAENQAAAGVHRVTKTQPSDKVDLSAPQIIGWTMALEERNLSHKVDLSSRYEIVGLKSAKQLHKKITPSRSFTVNDIDDLRARCDPYAPEVMYQKVHVDKFIETLTIISSANPPQSLKVPVDILLPSVGLDPASTSPIWRDCNSTCDFNPTVDFTVAEKVLRMVCGETEFELCAPQFKEIFDGQLYTGYGMVPLEATFLDLVTNFMVRDLQRQMLTGDPTTFPLTDRWEGIYTQMANDVTIPTGQSLAQAPWTLANVVAQLDEMVEALPDFVWDKFGVTLAIPESVWRLYKQAVRTQFTNLGDNLATSGLTSLISYPNVNVLPMWQLENQVGADNKGRAFIYLPEHTFIGQMGVNGLGEWHSETTAVPLPKKKVMYSSSFWSGVTYQFSNEVVVSLIP